MALCTAVTLATLVSAAGASAQAPPPPPVGEVPADAQQGGGVPAYTAPAQQAGGVPAYAPPAWLTEGLELVKQKAPAADCELKYIGELWRLDNATCRFEGRPVSGAVANGHCGAGVAPTFDTAAPYEVGYDCVIWWGPEALRSCARFSLSGADAWHGGEFKRDAPHTLHAELVECLDSQSPGPQDVAKLSGERNQRFGSGVSVDVTCAERCTARGTGKLTIAGGGKSFKLKAATTTIGARSEATLELAISKKARRAARRALNTNKQVRAKLAITVVDAVGTRRTKHRTVRLRL